MLMRSIKSLATVICLALTFFVPLAVDSADAAPKKKHHRLHQHRAVCKPVKSSKAIKHKAGCKTRSHAGAAAIIPTNTELTTGPMSKTIELALPYVGLNARYDRTTLTKLMGGVDPLRTAWCVGFANVIMDQAGIETVDSLAVKDYMNWGHAVADPRIGDVVILRFKRRPGPSHIGFLYGITNENGRTIIQVLGGNQSKNVQVSQYDIHSVISIRRKTD
jgi:uncharacterized protein (TIGR02594 family)